MQQEKLVSLRSLVSRRRPVRQNPVNAVGTRRADGPRATGIEPLESRVFLNAAVLTPVADSFVRDPDFNTTNFGASPYLYVKTAGSGDSRIAYLKFDVSGWTPEQVGNATLYLAGALQTPTTPAQTIGVFPVGPGDWVEGDGTIAIRNPTGGSGGSQLTGTALGDGYDRDNSPAGEITWDNRPTIAGGPLSSARVERESFHTYAFDLTGYIQQQRQAGQNLVTVAVQSLEPTAHLARFISRDFGGAGRPQLVIARAGDVQGQAVRSAVNAPDLTTGGVATHTVTVTYTSTSPIDISTIDRSDLSVTRDGGNAIGVLDVTVDPPFNSSSVTATYTLGAPGAAWEATDNDLFTIQVRPGEVRDVDGNDNVANFDSFRARAWDSAAPVGAVNAPNVTAAGASTYSFTVTYTDNIKVDVATINVDNVSMGLPGGGRAFARSVTFEPDGDAASVVATYTIDAPGGSWGPEDTGNYLITLHTQSVRDLAANEAVETNNIFSVAIADPQPQLAPTASIAAPDIGAAGTGTQTVTVLYTDDHGINAGTVDTNDITVTGPGGLALTVVDASVSPGGSATPQTATYTIAPPPGGWTDGRNGQYTIALQPNQVFDTDGLAAATVTGTFDVTIAPPPPADSAPPTAVIHPVNVTSGGGQTHAITITYTDNVALRVSSFGPEDVTVLGPGNVPLHVSGVSQSPNSGDTSPISVTYQIDAPGGTWTDDADGNYSITLNAGQVFDTSNNAAPQVTAGFTVDIGGPDTAGPNAQIIVEGVSAPGAADHLITITYTDDGKVNAGSIDVSDISVVRNRTGEVLTVTGRSLSPDKTAQSITVVYTIAAPGGTWDPADDDVYTVTLKGGAVTDRKGNGNNAASATFTVATEVPDTTPPGASVAPIAQVTTAGDTPLVVTVTYTDNQGLPLTAFDANDLVVTGDNGVVFGPASNVTVVQGADQTVYTVTYQFAPPGGTWDVSDTGTYSVNIAAGAVTDFKNNSASLPAPAVFTVNVPAPPAEDPTFGSGNPIATNFVTEGIVTQPDGKLVLVGRRGVAGGPDVVGVIQRRNPDGTLDTTFGTGGEVLTEAGAGLTWYAVGLQSSGAIVVAGTNGADFVIARYLTSGAPDPTFGSAGRTMLDFGLPGEAAYALAVGGEDKVVVAGSSADHFAFGRLTASGAPDPTFGDPQSIGKVAFDRDGVDVVGAVAIQRDGKIVAAGASGPDVVVIRLTVAGDQDFSFGTTDKSVVTIPGLASRLEAAASADHSQALAIQRDDKILVGNFTAGADADFGIARIDLAGNLDTTFGNGGIASVNLGGTDDVDAIVLQETGEILAVGTTFANGTAVTAVAAFDTTGQLITGFGTGGFRTFDSAVLTPGREVHIGDVVLRAFGTRQADGRLVVVGTDRSPAQSVSSLRRLIVPGTRALPQGTEIGSFGLITAGSRKATKFVDPITGAIFTMKGGSGRIFRGDDGRINLVLTDAGAGVSVSVKSKGRLALGDVIVNGNVRSMQVKFGDLSGTMFVTGNLLKLKLGAVAGTIAAGAAIGVIQADSLAQAKILAGANLGDDAKLGGTDSNGDTFNASAIRSLKVKGAISQSIVAAGLNPIDGVFGNDDAVVIPGSAIGRLSASTADDASRFYAAQFGSVKLPKKIKDVSTDERFKTA
jgi:uncharacterized delta-60 repeat protein